MDKSINRTAPDGPGSHQPRKAVALATGLLFVSWLVLNFGRLTVAPDDRLRLLAGLLFSSLILFRRKPLISRPEMAARTVLATVACAALMIIGGLVFRVHQVEWLGIILVIYASLRWALPRHVAPDLLIAVCLLYMIHPLPTQVLGPMQLGM